VCSDNQNIRDNDKEGSYSDWEESVCDSDSQPQTKIWYQELQAPKHTPPATLLNTVVTETSVYV
jgi:hypothetical protein